MTDEKLRIAEDLAKQGRLIGNWPELVNQQMECAEILLEKNDWSQALERYREILRLEEAFFSPTSSRGNEDTPQLKAAIKSVKPLICLQIGRHYLSRQEVDLAIQYLRKALELKYESWEAHLSLGKAYTSLGMCKEARGHWQELCRLAPYEAAPAYEFFAQRSVHKRFKAIGFLQAADAYLKKQDRSSAIRVLHRVLDLEPTNGEVLKKLGELYDEEGKPKEASEYIARAKKAASDAPGSP